MSTTHDPDNSRSILFMLGQLTAKVDTLLNNQAISDERHDSLASRVSTLEKDKAKVIGVALGVSALVGGTLNYFMR
jgi:hypothetical protein